MTENTRDPIGPIPGPASSHPLRKRPARGLLPNRNTPTIVFITVCTKDRKPWLATPAVHALLKTVWLDASAWSVGRYTLMPDHLHLFAAPNQEDIPLDNWVRYWKSQFSKRHGQSQHAWQAGYWDTRLRSLESYDSKWDYVRNNPVRQGLVDQAEEWEFQGTIQELIW